MKAYPPAKVRNVALVGHGGSGKTTLTEALLLCSGAINRAGRVEDGTTVSDFEPEEHSHHMSTSLTLAALEWRGYKVNVLDCPGYADFVPEALAGLSVADLAVFVVSAVDGVEVQTEIFWKAAAALGIPAPHLHEQTGPGTGRFLRRPANSCTSLRRRRGPARAAHRGGATTFTASPTCSPTPLSSTRPASALPPEAPYRTSMAAQEHTVRDSLVEGIVVADDDLMARYLEGEEVPADELAKTLARGVVSSQVFPVICGSATKLVGIDRLLDTICDVAPSPLERPPARGAGSGRPAAPRPSRSPATRPASRWPGCSRPSPTPT